MRLMVRSYLSNRRLDKGGSVVDITAGVPQGSVVGPWLRCVFYDLVLEEKWERETDERDVELSCFADDLGIIVSAKSRVKLVARSNRILKQLTERLTAVGISVAPEKTMAVMMSSRSRHHDSRGFEVSWGLD